MHMGTLDGRVAIVTGAGRGLGRAHALLLAQQGARVVVNDPGAGPDGAGTDAGPAADVVAEIVAAGGEAVVSTESVASFAGAAGIVRTALDTYGDLHIVINNAGILRDRMLVGMSEEEFDDVIAVHVKGTFAVTRHAVDHWREKSKRIGGPVEAAVVNTSSPAGLHGNVGQTNYSAAKAAIAAMTVSWAKELVRYGVRVNAIAPVARTRLTEQSPGSADFVKAPEAPGALDRFAPEVIAPLVVHLASPSCTLTGQVFGVDGGRISRYRGWSPVEARTSEHGWTLDEVAAALADLPSVPPG